MYGPDMPALKVAVTAPLIERATARDSRHCMIAEAILAARPDFVNVIVDLATIRWSNPRTRKRYVCLTPEVAAAELVKFDQGQPIKPFELNLTPIQVTDMTRVKETPTEAKAAGRKTPRRERPTRDRTLSTTTGGAPLVVGGQPLPMGHLSSAGDVIRRPVGVADPAGSGVADPADPPTESSNVVRSGRRYRQYGRRLLAG